MNRHAFLIFFLLSLFQTANLWAYYSKEPVVVSPNGALSFRLIICDGKLMYTILFNGSIVIEPAEIGLVINGKSISNAVAIGEIKQNTTHETYDYRGVHSKASNHFRSARISINGETPFILHVKVFNDGVAFQYFVNEKDSASIVEDNTCFALPKGSIMWSQSSTTHYEARYTQRLIDTVQYGLPIGPPATIVLPNHEGFMAITEAGLTDFAGMSLLTGGNRKLKVNLAGATKIKGKIETPWRIIEIGKELNTLVNCDIIANVSKPWDKALFPGGYQTEWIKPGRSVWSWLAESGSVTLENMKRFTDQAALLGFEYNLVDDGWRAWKDTINNRDCWDMMKELVQYSAAKGVKIWVWQAYMKRNGIPGIKDKEQRVAFFKRCKELGIVGLKLDFFDSEEQEIIQFYQAALKDAASFQLMMNFHGANKPTGESRTWPNEMTREAIKGLESRPPWAKHNTILPFTRYLAGHADYTPVHFGERMGDVTWAHHTATSVIFTSPFLCFGANPQSILNNPCREMIQSIPSTWDETIVLSQSKIGELVLYARRKGTTWFLGGVSSVAAINITLKLDFLGKGNYRSHIVQDNPAKKAAVIIVNKKVKAIDTLLLPLNINGGFIARFEKE